MPATNPRPTRRHPTPAALAALCLALAGLASAGARADDDADLRTIVVTGQGEVSAAPDRAVVTLGIQTRQPTVEAARTEANRVTERLLKVARDLGIPEKHVRSTRIQVNPEYDWQNPGRRELLGYSVQRQLIVDLRDLEKLGELMEKGLSAGANLAGEPALDSSRRQDLDREALALAVADARKNAEVLAKSLGASVGQPRTVASSAGFQPPMPMPAPRVAMAEMKSADAPETYQAGELTFTATASVTFDLVPGPVR